MNARLIGLISDRKNQTFDGECHLTNEEADEIIAALTAAPASAAEPAKCQYSEDVSMPEYRCVGRCQYDESVTERRRCLAIVDEFYGGGRSFLMKKIQAEE